MYINRSYIVYCIVVLRLACGAETVRHRNDRNTLNYYILLVVVVVVVVF